MWWRGNLLFFILRWEWNFSSSSAILQVKATYHRKIISQQHLNCPFLYHQLHTFNSRFTTIREIFLKNNSVSDVTITHGWKTNFDSLEAKSWTTYHGVQSFHNLTSLHLFPVLSSPLSTSSPLSLSGLFSLSLPPSPTPTHSPALLKPSGLLHSYLFAFSGLGKHLPYFLPFPLSLPTHPSFIISVQMPSLHEGSPLLPHL